MKKRMLMILLLGACVFVLSSCAANANMVSLREAHTIIDADLTKNGASYPELEIIEITPKDVWEKTSCQLFKIINGSSWDTFVIVGKQAYRIGTGFGGNGVASVIPYDIDQDGTQDLVYAYSWGSGMHRSEIAWFDMHHLIEHPGKDPLALMMVDVLLKVEDGAINVYVIDMEQAGVDLSGLRTYPVEKDIETFALKKIGVLKYAQNELLLITD